MAKATSQSALANALRTLSGLSKEDLTALEVMLTEGPAEKAPKPKAAIYVVVNDAEEQEQYGTVVTVWKDKGNFQEPLIGIRDHEDLVGLIEELQVAELEIRP